MAIGWSDLTQDEQTALKRMNRGPYPGLTATLAERLISLGLAVERPAGIGISRVGRELVISTLLGARADQAESDRQGMPDPCLDFPGAFTNYGYMNSAIKIRRDFLFRVCPIAGS